MGMQAKRFLSKSEINEIVGDVLATHEVSPLSPWRMRDIAVDSCRERFGFLPSLSLILLVVKLTRLGWEARKRATKRQLREGN